MPTNREKRIDMLRKFAEVERNKALDEAAKIAISTGKDIGAYDEVAISISQSVAMNIKAAKRRVLK